MYSRKLSLETIFTWHPEGNTQVTVHHLTIKDGGDARVCNLQNTSTKFNLGGLLNFNPFEKYELVKIG